MKPTEHNFIVGVLPKEGLAGPHPLGMTTTKILRTLAMLGAKFLSKDECDKQITKKEVLISYNI